MKPLTSRLHIIRQCAPLFAMQLDHYEGPTRLTEAEWVLTWKSIIDGLVDALIIAIILAAIGLAVWYVWPILK